MKIGCALLAAGAGKRFGGGKLLFAIVGEAMIARAARLFGGLPFDARVCVARADSPEVFEAARANGFIIAVNPDPDRGVGTSVAAATQALLAASPDLDGILYAVCDQPYLTDDSALRLLEAFLNRSDRIAALSWNGSRGNPAVFPRSMFAELSRLSEDIGGGAVIRRHPELLLLVEANSARELEDVDARENL